MKSIQRSLAVGLTTACLVAGTTLVPAGAAVHHIWISHRPAPPLRTIEIGRGTPPEAGPDQLPAARCVSINCPQDGPPAKTDCLGCQRQPDGVTIVKIGM
jgi:hypothetical protein